MSKTGSKKQESDKAGASRPAVAQSGAAQAGSAKPTPAKPVQAKSEPAKSEPEKPGSKQAGGKAAAEKPEEAQTDVSPPPPPPVDVHDAMRGARVWDVPDASGPGGVSLMDICQKTQVLVVCVRHMGCTFCRETLADIAAARITIQNRGMRIVVVHMSPVEDARKVLAKYNLGAMHGVGHISDPEKVLYGALELKRGRFKQLFAPRVLLRGVIATIISGHWPSKPVGDAFQMPGAFVAYRGTIIKAFRHNDIADRPDLCDLAGV